MRGCQEFPEQPPDALRSDNRKPCGVVARTQFFAANGAHEFDGIGDNWSIDKKEQEEHST
jgi:hypothetical protein